MKQPTTAEVINLGRFTACWADNTLEQLQILIAEEAAPELIDRTLAAFERLAKTMLTLAPLLRRTISAPVCVFADLYVSSRPSRRAIYCHGKRGMLSTTTHDDILTLRLYATENDWRAFNLFYKILVKNHRAGVVAKGTNTRKRKRNTPRSKPRMAGNSGKILASSFSMYSRRLEIASTKR
jgi:hypothetical protein